MKLKEMETNLVNDGSTLAHKKNSQIFTLKYFI